MRIAVFGLGYVGVVSAACLARDGHSVIGVDPNLDKVALINEGVSPIVEQQIGSLIQNGVSSGQLRAIADPQEAVLESDLSLVCVGTPGQPNGSLDMKFVQSVCRDLGAALKIAEHWHVVVMRSTMLPGQMRLSVLPALEEHSGKKAGTDFGVCFNPEFLREGTAVADFDNPAKTVIGELDDRSGDQLAEIYQSIDAPLIRTDLETAEMVKYVDNVWHALKVSFANEIGSICKAQGIDSHAVMDIFCQDTKLNISPTYLRPGFAFGGSCLPKDVRALTYQARSMDLETPVLSAILPSNAHQVDRAFSLIQGDGRKQIGILGMSFKEGTDDLRESPMVGLIETLIGKGYDVRIFDRNVNMAKLVGANKEYILSHIPHISRLLLDDPLEVLKHAEVLVVGTAEAEFKDLLNQVSSGTSVIDLVRLNVPIVDGAGYEGICW